MREMPMATGTARAVDIFDGQHMFLTGFGLMVVTMDDGLRAFLSLYR
jgi:type IV secretory pathway TrbD component